MEPPLKLKVQRDTTHRHARLQHIVSRQIKQIINHHNDLKGNVIMNLNTGKIHRGFSLHSNHFITTNKSSIKMNSYLPFTAS